MDSHTVVSLLGSHSSTPRVEAALEQFRIRRRPCASIDEDDVDGPVVESCDWLKNRHAGIEFGFEEESSFTGQPNTVGNGDHPMLLTQLSFAVAQTGMQAYSGQLPFGLVATDSRQRVREKLTPFEETRRSYLRDTWELPFGQLVVSYTETGSTIGFILCALRRPPSRRTRDAGDTSYSSDVGNTGDTSDTSDTGDAPVTPVAPVAPRIDELIGLLGRGLDDPALRTVVEPLRIDGHLIPRRAGLLALARADHGIELSFDVAGSEPPHALTRIVLYRDREAGATGWLGGLPFGLAFDDSPEDVFRTMGRTPDETSERDFDGSATWQMRGFSILVTYCTMLNWILSVSISRAGPAAQPAVH